MEQPPISTLPKKKKFGPFVSLSAVVIIAVLGFLGYQVSASQNLTNQLPESNSEIAFSDTGVTERFLLSHFSLLAQPRIHVGEAVIVESQKIPGSADQAVLAEVPHTEGTVLGLLHGNGNFEPVLSDGTQKTDLHVVKGTTVVYTVLLNPVVWPDAQAVSQNAIPESDEQIEEGHATGPVDTGVDYKTNATDNQAFPLAGGILFAFNLGTDSAPRSLGAGKSPRLMSDGSVVAVAHDGIVKIDAASGARTVLFAYQGGDDAGGTLSPDGTVALLHTKGNSVSDVYAIAGGKVTAVGSIISTSPTFGAAFADNEHIFLRTGRTSVALYKLPDDTASLKPPTAHLSIIAPQ